MSNRSKKEESKKMIVRVVCIALAALMALTAFTSVMALFWG